MMRDELGESLSKKQRVLFMMGSRKLIFYFTHNSLLLNRTPSLFCISSQLFWLFRFLIPSAVILRR